MKVDLAPFNELLSAKKLAAISALKPAQ
jgi:hypothetical protein